MEHPVEMLVHAYLDNARSGKVKMSDETIQGIVKHVEAAVRRQFQPEGERKFRLRASNIGRATCQLWFSKNKPEAAVPPASHFLLRMMIGDITEAQAAEAVAKDQAVTEAGPSQVVEDPEAVPV